MPTGPDKAYKLEIRFSIVEVDSGGYSASAYNRFELNDVQQLGDLPLPVMLEMMANLHTAFKRIGEIATGQCAEPGNNG